VCNDDSKLPSSFYEAAIYGEQRGAGMLAYPLSKFGAFQAFAQSSDQSQLTPKNPNSPNSQIYPMTTKTVFFPMALACPRWAWAALSRCDP